jgi:hypothetical protein
MAPVFPQGYGKGVALHSYHGKNSSFLPTNFSREPLKKAPTFSTFLTP